MRAYTEEKTIITPFRETLVSLKYSNSDQNLFNHPFKWSCDLFTNMYDDKSFDPADFNGFGTHFKSLFKASDNCEVRTRYYLTQRQVERSSDSFLNHMFTVDNTYTVNHDINIVSGIEYTRNNARSSFQDFINKKIHARYNHTLPSYHRFSTHLSAEFRNYHDNILLEKDSLLFKTQYTIPLTDIEHRFRFEWDKRKFPRSGSNGYEEFTTGYTAHTTPDMHKITTKHDTRLSYLIGKSAVKNYCDGMWEFRLETPAQTGRRYYIDNTFQGRFWQNQKKSLPELQHYVEDTVGTGVIVQNETGGIVMAGPILGTRQSIDPQSHNNTVTYDHPLYKNPWSSFVYGGKIRTDIPINGRSQLNMFLLYKNFVNYNDHTSTEFVNLDFSFSHQWATRIRAVAEIKYAQNVNDLVQNRLDNSFFNILFKFEYLFELVI